MRIVFTLFISLVHLCVFAQVMAGFENFNLKAGQYLNDASPAKGFESGSISLPNDYNAEFEVWSGFAISADTNTTTPGYLNQYSAIPGLGALNTTAYAVGYIFDPVTIELTGTAIGKRMIGLYVTNTTYAYYSLRDGDAFAKKFGGESGKDPDFFLLTIKKYSGGAISDDSINVYLADYRSSDPSKDYILDDWTYVDLTFLAEVDSLVLRLSSSDNGLFGMNTPAYIAIDQVSTDNLLSASDLDKSVISMTISPNPVRESLYIHMPEKGNCAITSIYGSIVWSETLEAGRHEVRVSDFPSGIYFVTNNGRLSSKICIE